MLKLLLDHSLNYKTRPIHILQAQDPLNYFDQNTPKIVAQTYTKGSSYKTVRTRKYIKILSLHW